jgi:hypothetical protein
MICSDCELLANITTLPKVHWLSESDLCWALVRVIVVPPPIISMLASIGNACIGIMSSEPSGTPWRIL